jgi:hypothetical protein
MTTREPGDIYTWAACCMRKIMNSEGGMVVDRAGTGKPIMVVALAAAGGG